MTVLTAIKLSSEFLEKKGVESPRLQAELLLADLLKLARMKLYLNFERALTSAEADAYRERVDRRGQREPLQYIIATASFCGLEIAVNRNVLIPRPETEQLAELGWSFLKQRAIDSTQVNALDFGTGSGCLAIGLTTQCSAAQADALDISEEALALARQNAQAHKVGHRIHFHHGSSFAVLPEGFRYDLIISNPPYIPSGDIENLQMEVRDFEPRCALDGGLDGLDFYRMMARNAAPFLKPGGRTMLEFGDSQSEQIREIFRNENWIVEAIHKDYNQRARMITVRLE
jgi:release factor glutamine methyltransferase